MAFTHTIVAHFPSHTEAETVVRELQQQGFDMQKLSLAVAERLPCLRQANAKCNSLSLENRW